MLYHHSFLVQAPLERVAEFHRAARSMAAITPPLLIVRIHQAPDPLYEGAEMSFTIWIGPIPIHWRAQIDDVSECGFRDRQISGPFRVWNHLHCFESVSAEVTRVVDEVHAELKRKPGEWLVGGLMVAGFPLLFAYRSWKTRRLLELSQSG